ncbi:MAG: S66 peptidase family protein [Rhodoferax sp.]
MESSSDNNPPLSRRNLAKNAALSIAATVVPMAAAAKTTARAFHLVKPRRLREGGMVGLITPCGFLEQEGIDKAVRNIEELGVRVRLGKHVLARRGRYAGTVAQRLEDLHAMFADPGIDAVWAATGGSGGISLLPHIDYRLIRNHPKIFVGYSDVTCLHLAIHRQTRLVTFHGPVGVSTFSDYSKQHLKAILMQPQEQYVMSMADENRAKAETASQYQIRTARHGTAVGRLTGGNLSLVAALSGTPYAAELQRRLLFLEDISEAPYRIDRMLTQLDLSQGLRSTAALILGVFEKCEAPENESSLTLNETIDSHLDRLRIPAVTGYSVGHIAHQMTLPLGLKARLDTSAQTLTLLENAVL